MEAAQQRRSLKYIRLAAYLADQPVAVDEITMSMAEVEDVVGDTLPPIARFPSWWRNDERKMHSRAWLSAGWEVAEVAGSEGRVVFVRKPSQ